MFDGFDLILCHIPFIDFYKKKILKTKTLKRKSLTPGMTPVKKQLRKFTNLRIHDEQLFTDDDDPVPDFGEKVISFMMDNDNSFECPDKKKEGVHYRRNTTEVLKEKFLCETMIECSARSFGRYVPENILNPRPEDWGISLCKVRLNSQLKVEGLKISNVLVDWLLSLTNKFEKQFSTDSQITYKEW